MYAIRRTPVTAIRCARHLIRATIVAASRAPAILLPHCCRQFDGAVEYGWIRYLSVFLRHFDDFL